MAPDTFLIDKRYLCENTPVDANQNANDVRNAMLEAQVFDLGFIGIPLLELFQAHMSGGTTLSPVQAQLFEMVRYYNAYRVYYHLSFNVFKVANAGVTQPQNSVSFADLKDFRAQIDAKCAGLKRRIQEYVQTNQRALPQAAPEPELTLADDPLDSLNVVWSPNVQRHFF